MSSIKKYLHWDYKRINMCDLDGAVEDVIEFLNNCKADAESLGMKNICINLEYMDGDIDMYLRGERLETDVEYEARIKIEENATILHEERRVKSIERRRKQYEKLKREFDS